MEAEENRKRLSEEAKMKRLAKKQKLQNEWAAKQKQKQEDQQQQQQQQQQLSAGTGIVLDEGDDIASLFEGAEGQAAWEALQMCK